MPRILAVGTAVPPHVITQDQAREFARHFFAARYTDIDERLQVFANTQVATRYICKPVEWFAEPKSFDAKNEAYIDWAQRLAGEAIERCLTRAEVGVRDVDYLIFVSTTGLATPSVDARLIGQLGMRAETRRTPIWGLGCAGGVAGLAHAHHYALGHPGSKTLVVAVELCSLTFHFHDKSKSNLVATALFGDGAAAVLVTGDETARGAATVVDTRSTLFPDSLDIMGWNLHQHGMQVVFSSAIPEIVWREARGNVEQFLADHQLAITDVEHWITHPGGPKIMEAYEGALELRNGALQAARDVLHRYGNMSSASVLFVLEECLRSAAGTEGSWGLMSALGPGFSSEQLLMRF